MTNYTNVIIKYLLGELTPAEKEHFEMELKFNKQLQVEYNLQLKMDRYMRARLKFEDAENDPLLELAEAQSKNDINYFLDKLNERGSNRNKMTIEEMLSSKLEEAEIELAISGVNNEIDKWTTDWSTQRRKRQQTVDAYQVVSYVQSFKPVQYNAPSAWHSRRKTTWVIGLGSTLLLLLALLLGTFSPHYSDSELYDMSYEPLSNVSFVQRSAATAAPKTIKEGIESYQAGNYQAAAEAFGKTLHENSEHPELMLFAALTKMANSDYNGAIEQFNLLLNTSEQYNLEAKWYLGLCYLKTGDHLKTKILMEDLIAQKVYVKKAHTILRNL